MKMNIHQSLKTNRPVLFLLLLFAVCLIPGGCGGKRPREYHVGILSGAESFNDIAAGFMARMTSLGYENNRNIFYDFQKSDMDIPAYRRIITQFISDRVDLIFVFPTEPALVAKETARGSGIPIVFAMSGIEGNSLVDSVSRPGDHITGVRYPGPELTVRRFDILIELVPGIRKVYLIYDRNYPNTSMALQGLRPAALSSGVRLVEDSVGTMEEFKAVLASRTAGSRAGVDAILVMPDIFNNSVEGFESIRKFATRHRLPIGGGMAFTADRGALFSYVPDNSEQGEQAALLADKIFKGTPAGSIMLVTPGARLRVNYRVIQTLGLSVDEGLLSRAYEIIR
jgi:putative tryptophan/tyrosine transport system substrate-binding protein